MPLIPAQDFPFCGATYLAASPVLDCQRSINLYPEPGLASSKSQMGLTGRPGLTSIGGTPLGSGFGHSLWAGSARLFAATGTSIYEISIAGGILTNYGGSLSNAGPTPVPMVANGIQLLACDVAAGIIYNVNPAVPSLDAVFNGIALEYLDDFYVAIAIGASLAGGNPNQINVSALGDGTTWPSLAFAIRTGTADLTIQLATLNSLLYIFGQKSIEIWYNAGNPIFPLARVNGGTINLGLMAAASVVKFYNCIVFLGADDKGSAQVYMLQGMNPVRVSNAAIEFMLANMSLNPGFLYAASAYGYQEAGHTFYCLNIKVGGSGPGALLTQYQLVYDLTTGLWHERNYGIGGLGFALTPTSYANVAGNFSTTVAPSFVMDETSGQVWYQSILIPNDGGTGNPIKYVRQAPHSGSQNRVFSYSRFELDMDPGATGSAGTIQPVLTYSNNGGRSPTGFSYPLQQAYDQGFPNGFQRFYQRQLGRSRDRVFEVTITSDVDLIRVVNAYLTAQVHE